MIHFPPLSWTWPRLPQLDLAVVVKTNVPLLMNTHHTREREDE